MVLYCFIVETRGQETKDTAIRKRDGVCHDHRKTQAVESAGSGLQHLGGA